MVALGSLYFENVTDENKATVDGPDHRSSSGGGAGDCRNGEHTHTQRNLSIIDDLFCPMLVRVTNDGTEWLLSSSSSVLFAVHH